MLRRRARPFFGVSSALASCLLLIQPAPAVGAPPSGGERWELEVHLAGGSGAPAGRTGGRAFGGGVRASVTLGSVGVSPRVADWIALGFGLDVVRFSGGGSPFGVCVERTAAPAGTSVCTRVDAPGAPRTYLFLPVVAQWSFAVAPQLSLFVEPGLALVYSDGGGGATAVLALGGRLRVTDTTNAVLRLGWPLSTLGLSF